MATRANRRCDYCGRAFAPARAHQRFCAPAHKDAWHAERRQAALKAYSSEGQSGAKNAAAVAMGRLGGLASGRVRRRRAAAGQGEGE